MQEQFDIIYCENCNVGAVLINTHSTDFHKPHCDCVKNVTLVDGSHSMTTGQFHDKYRYASAYMSNRGSNWKTLEKNVYDNDGLVVDVREKYLWLYGLLDENTWKIFQDFQVRSTKKPKQRLSLCTIF